MKFGLMFFAASEDSLGADKYRLVVDSARFADQAGFSTVWVPERHFTAFGGLYPNPAVLHAALAMCTSVIRLNAGSVVAPLHHPLRIAEEWSVVDNLSNGRVGLSFASGWNPNDFVFFPERYENRHEHVMETMRAVQALWRGEAFAGNNGAGQPCSVQIFPKPVQSELPLWATVAGNPRNFERAGASGVNLLTHLLDQDEDVLASRIALYRDARAAAGFDPATGEVSLMIHTLVGADADLVREQARGPYCAYIKANIGLFRGLAQSRGREADLSAMSPADLDEFTNFLYDRFAASRGLIGTSESCAPLVARLERIGVTELACLLDFGPSTELILENLPHLAQLKDLARHEPARSAAPPRVESTTPFNRAEVRQRCTQEMSGSELLRILGRHGIQVDGAFQPETTVWRRDGEALAQLALWTDTDNYHVHPAALDACSRILAAALTGFGSDEGTTYVPAGVATCDVHAPLSGVVWVHGVMTPPSDGTGQALVGDIRAYDESGRVLVEVGGIRLAPIEYSGEAVSRTQSTDVSSLLYERVWRRAAAPDAATSDMRGRWELIADRGGVAAELSRLLEQHGGECVTGSDMSELRGVVYLRGLDAVTASDANTDALKRDVERTVRGALALVQASGSTPVWLVTQGATAGAVPATEISVAQSPLWGLGRTLAVERPGTLGGLVDLDPTASAVDSARQLLDVLTHSRNEDMVALRSGVRYVPRLARVEPPLLPVAPTAFDAEDTVLITGGTGGLGLRLVEWLAARGARHLILCSRRPPEAAAKAQLDRLTTTGVDLVALQVDVADYETLRQQLDTAVACRPGVTGVFHLAGALDDAQIASQSWDRFSGVFASKVDGAWNLHRWTQGTTLKHFVLFSSVASMVPVAGQSNYAAANAFLDALAHHRRAQGLPALAVNWGPWSEVGHAATDYGRQAHRHLATLGIGAVAPDQGMRVLDQLLGQDRVQAAAVSVDWPRLFRADPEAGRLGFLAELVDMTGVAQDDRIRQPSELLDGLQALPLDQRRPHVMSYLSDMVIAALKLRTEDPIDGRVRLFDIGLDSIMALELKNQLERALGVKLSATLLFVRPTLESLADYILTEIFTDRAPAGIDVPPSPDQTLTEEDLTAMLLREIDASRRV
jgi:natural product biosynthesis luciferase-like monooxygenase protein